VKKSWVSDPAGPRMSFPSARRNVKGGRHSVLSAFLLVATTACAWFSIPLRGETAAPVVNVAPTPVSSAFDFSYVVRVDPPSGSNKIRVWMPLPSTDQFQTISEVQITSPVRVQIHKQRQYNNRYAYFDVDSARVRTGFEVRVAFHVVRYERRLDFTSSKLLPDPPPQEIAPFLQPDSLFPVDGATANLSRQLTEDVSDPLEKARRIYDYVISSMRRSDQAPNAGRGDTARAVELHQGNCADFHSLFITLARAAGIPARIEIGFSLPEDQRQGTLAGYQNWAEFYVNGLGWIPLDAWESSQQSGNPHEQFFGLLDAHRVMISTGRDVALTPAAPAARLRSVAYPYIEANGQASPIGSMEFFFNAIGLEIPPKIFRKPIFARRSFTGHEFAS
jgi:hypothetical protein